MTEPKPAAAAARRYAGRRLLAALLATALTGLGAEAPAQEPDPSSLRITEYPYNVHADGEDLPIELGHFDVPADWENEDSATITVGFVRYLAGEGSGSTPIVFLVAGQPREAERERLYASLRRFGNVYEFNYRGYGLSSVSWSCTDTLDLPASDGLGRRALNRATRRLAGHCAASLEAAGFEPDLLSSKNAARDVGRLLSLTAESRAVLVAENVLLNTALEVVASRGDAIAGLVVANPTLSVPAGKTAVPQSLVDELAGRSEGIPLRPDAEESIRVGVGALDFAFLEASARQSEKAAEQLQWALERAADDNLSELASLVYDNRIDLNARPASLAMAMQLPKAEFRRWRRADDVRYAWWWPVSALDRSSTKHARRVLGKRTMDVLVIDRVGALAGQRAELAGRFTTEGSTEFAGAADSARDLLVARQADLRRFIATIADVPWSESD